MGHFISVLPHIQVKKRYYADILKVEDLKWESEVSTTSWSRIGTYQIGTLLGMLCTTQGVYLSWLGGGLSQIVHPLGVYSAMREDKSSLLNPNSSTLPT